MITTTRPHTSHITALHPPQSRARPRVLAARAAAILVAFWIGAALRHYTTSEIPASLSASAITLWGWPFGLPLSGAILWITRPLS